MQTWKHRIARIGKTMSACLAAGALVSADGDRVRLGSRYERIPFTMEYIQTITNVMRGTTFALDMFWAVRSDGARSYGLAGIYPRRRTVVDPVRKLMAKMSDAYKLKATYDFSSYPVTPQRIEYGPNCRPPDNMFSYVGDDIILGYLAHHYIRKPVEGAGGNHESHYWFAPDLGCHKIQHLMYMRDANGAITNIFEEKPARIRREEPDPMLFDVPAAYREVYPSEFEKTLLYGEVQKREGYERASRFVIPESTLNGWAIADQQYESVKKVKAP